LLVVLLVAAVPLLLLKTETMGAMVPGERP
jgi:hypothetical protein